MPSCAANGGVLLVGRPGLRRHREGENGRVPRGPSRRFFFLPDLFFLFLIKNVSFLFSHGHHISCSCVLESPPLTPKPKPCVRPFLVFPFPSLTCLSFVSVPPKPLLCREQFHPAFGRYRGSCGALRVGTGSFLSPSRSLTTTLSNITSFSSFGSTLSAHLFAPPKKVARRQLTVQGISFFFHPALWFHVLLTSPPT